MSGRSSFPAAVCLRRDVRDRALALDPIADRVAIDLARRHDRAWREVVQHHVGNSAVRSITAGQEEAERAAFTIGEAMELAVAAAPTDPNRSTARPLFRRPPNGDVLMKLSINTSAGEPSAAANVANRSCHTPSAHRTKPVRERLPRSVAWRRTESLVTRFDDVDDTADQSPIVNPRNPANYRSETAAEAARIAPHSTKTSSSPGPPL